MQSFKDPADAASQRVSEKMPMWCFFLSKICNCYAKSMYNILSMNVAILQSLNSIPPKNTHTGKFQLFTFTEVPTPYFVL